MLVVGLILVKQKFNIFLQRSFSYFKWTIFF